MHEFKEKIIKDAIDGTPREMYELRDWEFDRTDYLFWRKKS